MGLRSPPAKRSIDDRLEFGVINLDKPAGPTSHTLAEWMTDRLAVDRAAHAGTLDPKVTGCLPILLGTATRLVPAMLRGNKEYVTILELHGPVPDDFESIVEEFVGEIYQKPPRKSAVRRRLRTRTIHQITIHEVEQRRALLRIRCESGTYVRKLCHDIGLALGTGAHMGDLRRTATEPFDDTDLVTTSELHDALAAHESGDSSSLSQLLQPGEAALRHLPSVTIAESAAKAVSTGAQVYAPGVIGCEPAALDPSDRPFVVCYTPNRSAVCLGSLVGDPDANTGVVVELQRVLV